VQRTVLATAFVLVAATATLTWVEVVERLRAPDPVAVRGTPAAIVWSERVFRSEAEFAAWLRRRGINYERWVRSHPDAVMILRSRDRAAAEAVARTGPAGPAKRAQRPATPSQRPADVARSAPFAAVHARVGTRWLAAFGIWVLALLIALGVAVVGPAARGRQTEPS
jgi:hypothetical protein